MINTQVTQEALAKFQSSQQVSTRTGNEVFTLTLTIIMMIATRSITMNITMIIIFMIILFFNIGIEHEETLLSESAARETSLNTQIIEVSIFRLYSDYRGHKISIFSISSVLSA